MEVMDVKDRGGGCFYHPLPPLCSFANMILYMITFQVNVLESVYDFLRHREY